MNPRPAPPTPSRAAIAHRRTPVRRGERALTLVEMIGVLAILATLTVILTAASLAAYRRLARDTEQNTLLRLAETLRHSVSADLLIPGPTNFAAQIARYGSLAPADILTNAQGNPRLLLVDPAITNGGWDLPFSQTANPLAGAGNGQLQNVRLLLVSSVGKPFTNGLPLPPGGKVSASAFSNLWFTQHGSLPHGFTWSGDPHDLCIQRIHLLDLFHPVAFNHADSEGPHTNGTLRLPGMPAFAPPSGAPNPSVLWLLQGTSITLSNAADGSRLSEIIRDPTSFTYEKGFWLRGAQGLSSPSTRLSRISGADFERAVDAFLAASTNSPGNNPGSATAAAAAVNAISNYVLWGTQGPNPTSLQKMGEAKTAMRSAFLNYTDLPPGQFNKP